MPFLISKNVSFGASTFLTNLNNLVSKGPVPKEQLTGAVQKAITKGKPPVSTRLISGAETLLNKTGKEDPLIGRMKFINNQLEKLGVKVGDEISFTPDSEYEFNVDGEKLYRMYTENITMVLNNG